MIPFLWILLLIGCCLVRAQDKPPPMLSGPRNWNIPDTTTNGTVFHLLSPAGPVSPDDEFEFGLEPSRGFNIVSSESEPLPFDVNSKTGEVFTNQSLLTLGGRNFILYATLRIKGNPVTSKYQVWAKINKSNNMTKFHVSPSTFFSIPSAAIPNYNLPDSELPPFSHSRPSNNVKPISAATSSTTITTKLTASSNRWINLNNTTTTTASTKQEMSKDIISSDEDGKKDGILAKSDLSSRNNSSIQAESIPAEEPTSKLIVAFIPFIVIVISVIIFGIVFLFRKKICRERDKIKKDDMKKSSCGVVSLEESMVLRNWRRVGVLSNRYNSWDLDSAQSAKALTKTKSEDKWEIPRHRIKVFNVLGEGCFGQVWKCEALNLDGKKGPTVVAVKMLKENAGEQERNDLLQELHVMKMLDPHPNVVRLLACCTERDPIFVIMEYVPNGKLQSFLRHSRAERYYNNMHGSSNTLTSRDLTSFCYQIAKGMQYLSSNGIIHRDLAARNILISENHTCKVADFGFARDIMTSHVYERKSEGRLPIRWMAPESLYDNTFSVKSDIWSFGILIWEIVTLGSTPYPGIPAAEVMRRVRDGYRLDKPEHCRRELYNIMYYCWDNDPKERPTFTDLVDLLEELLLTETDYIQLERFPDHSYYNMVSLSGEKL